MKYILVRRKEYQEWICFPRIFFTKLNTESYTSLFILRENSDIAQDV